MERATTILSKEHQNIIRVLDVIEAECNTILSDKQIDKDFFIKAIDFIKNYADKFHHAKEEDILFEELGKDPSQMHCNPMMQMLHEHDIGRGYVSGLEEGINNDEGEKVIDNARGYCQLLRQHIFKEDNILYKMADDALSQESQEAILEKFNEVEKVKFGDEHISKYLDLIKEFEERKIKEG